MLDRRPGSTTCPLVGRGNPPVVFSVFEGLCQGFEPLHLGLRTVAKITRSYYAQRVIESCRGSDWAACPPNCAPVATHPPAPSRFSHCGKQQTVGLFGTAREAALAYDVHARAVGVLNSSSNQGRAAR